MCVYVYVCICMEVQVCMCVCVYVLRVFYASFSVVSFRHSDIFTAVGVHLEDIGETNLLIHGVLGEQEGRGVQISQCPGLRYPLGQAQEQTQHDL